MDASPVTLPLDDVQAVSGLFSRPRGARACLVLAHGAGAGMQHPFLAGLAADLAARGVACLRYQFPFIERGTKRPDAPAVAHAAVRAAVTAAARLAPRLPLFAGGKSFGGRMTSQAQAATPLPRVRGIVFVGFPLHAAGKPGVERTAHLGEVKVPMLFLQGDRDDLADLALLRPEVARLGRRAHLEVFPGADHAFHVPVRSGGNDLRLRAELAAAVAAWIDEVLAA
ncbi:MAG: alpha/beta family hydrolase [Burkholderiales bacterium]